MKRWDLDYIQYDKEKKGSTDRIFSAANCGGFGPR